MEQNKYILEFKDVTVGYSNNELIKNINLSISKGELIGLTGLNGTGKTSLFKTILKELPLLSGDCYLNNNNINSVELNEWVSVVFTDKIEALGLTVQDVLQTGKWKQSNWRGKISAKTKNSIVKYTQKLSIEHLVNTPITKLSDGQFQKVMIAKSLIQETPIILLDEPTAFLDVKNKKEIFELLKNTTKYEGKTILVSTHNLDFCKDYCDRVLLIKNNTLKETKDDRIEKELLNA